MSYSGFINWGPVTAFIVLKNVRLVGGSIDYADVEIYVNEKTHIFTIEVQS